MCCGIVGRMFNLSRNLTFSQHSYSYFFIYVSITSFKFKFKLRHFSGTPCASQVGSIPFPSRPPAVWCSCIAAPEKLPCNCHRRAPHKDTLYEGGLGRLPAPPPGTTAGLASLLSLYAQVPRRQRAHTFCAG